MGIFGAPLSFDNDAERAVMCALAMRKAIEEDNNKSENRAQESISASASRRVK